MHNPFFCACDDPATTPGTGLLCGSFFVISIMPHLANTKLGVITWDMIIVGLGGLFVTFVAPILVKFANDIYDKALKPKFFPEKKESKDKDVVK